MSGGGKDSDPSSPSRHRSNDLAIKKKGNQMADFSTIHATMLSKALGKVDHSNPATYPTTIGELSAIAEGTLRDLLWVEKMLEVTKAQLAATDPAYGLKAVNS